MKRILIINGVEPYPYAPGQLNATFVDVDIARKYFESNGCEVKETKVCEEYDVDTEVDKLKEADLELIQFPLQWFNVSWFFKKYIDIVLNAGQGKLAGSDGRHRNSPKEGYGTGELIGRWLMFRLSQ